MMASRRRAGNPDEKTSDRQERYARLGPACSSGPVRWTRGAPSAGSATGSASGSARKVYEIGWSVLPEHQGRGLARSATAAAVEPRPREHGHLGAVHAFPSVDNTPSNALCRSVGFELLGPIEFEYPPVSTGCVATTGAWPSEADQADAGEREDDADLLHARQALVQQQPGEDHGRDRIQRPEHRDDARAGPSSRRARRARWRRRRARRWRGSRRVSRGSGWRRPFAERQAAPRRTSRPRRRGQSAAPTDARLAGGRERGRKIAEPSAAPSASMMLAARRAAGAPSCSSREASTMPTAASTIPRSPRTRGRRRSPDRRTPGRRPRSPRSARRRSSSRSPGRGRSSRAQRPDSARDQRRPHLRPARPVVADHSTSSATPSSPTSCVQRARRAPSRAATDVRPMKSPVPQDSADASAKRIAIAVSAGTARPASTACASPKDALQPRLGVVVDVGHRRGDRRMTSAIRRRISCATAR